MGAGSDDDMGHADETEGFGKILREAGLEAHEIAETEIYLWRWDKIAETISKPMLKPGKNITNFTALESEDLGAIHFCNKSAEAFAELPF